MHVNQIVGYNQVVNLLNAELDEECDEDGEWILHTIMIEGCDAPFKFRRTKKYKSLKGQQVNLTYYPDSESVAGFEIEVMRVVRIKQH